MISQETKDIIEKEARQNAKAYRNSFEPKLISKDTLLEAELAYRYSEIAVATNYAEKLEEKEKEIEKLTEDSRLWKIAHDNCANHFDDLKKQLESKDKELMAMANITRQTELNLKLQVEAKENELAQLKEIAEEMGQALKELQPMALANYEHIRDHGSSHEEFLREDRDSLRIGREALTAYAEWCKQINKAK